MQRNALLEQIWNGSVALFCQEGGGEIAQGIRALMPVETISLCNRARHDLPRVMPESEELIPGLSLGDVLTEELGIDVPYGALVVFEEVAGGAGRTAETPVDKALRHIVPAAGADGGDEKARRAVEMMSGFRDGGLNAHFFGARGGRAMAETGREAGRPMSGNGRSLG